MAHLRQVGQGHSAECGYFSAYALKVVRDNPGNVGAWMMDPAVVRQARHDYLTSTDQRTGQYFSHYRQLIGFLAHLGAGQYTARPNLGGRGGRTPEQFVRNINAHLRPGRGVMLLFEGAGYRHYLDLLPGAGAGHWHFYDPASHVTPHFSAVPSLGFAEFELARDCPIHEHVTYLVVGPR